jgi:hypothetical protein
MQTPNSIRTTGKAPGATLFVQFAVFATGWITGIIFLHVRAKKKPGLGPGFRA